MDISVSSKLKVQATCINGHTQFIGLLLEVDVQCIHIYNRFRKRVLVRCQCNKMCLWNSALDQIFQKIELFP